MASNRSSVSWEGLEAMPTKRVFASPVYCNGKIYVLGGCNVRGTPLDVVEAFDIEKNVWESKKSLSSPRAQPAVVALGKLIYCIGGVDGKQIPMPNVEVFDAEKDEWKAVKNLPNDLMGTGAVVREGQIYVVGGMGSDKKSSSELLRYDPDADEWFTEDSMATPRYAVGAFNIKDRLYVLGGRDTTKPVRAFEVYDFETKRWRTLPELPSGRVFPMYGHTEKNIFSIGGLRPITEDKKVPPGFADDTDVFNLEKETWSLGEAMPTRRGDAAIAVLDNKVIVAGGLNAAGVPLNNAELYDEVSDTWCDLKQMPSAHCSCTYITVNERLFVIGGLSKNGPTGAVDALGLN